MPCELVEATWPRVSLDNFVSWSFILFCETTGRAFQGSSTDLTLNPPPLHYKKFSLQDQQKTNDCHALGTVAPNQFDHLVTASIAGGFHARYRYEEMTLAH
jgi:Rab3 GTPase-activating protein regulatory subunit N-terminus